MEFDEYQKHGARTGFYNHDDQEYILMFLCLGLAGESGEVIEKIKKVIRNDKGVVSSEKREELKREIGDVLWYLSQLAKQLDIPLNEVAKANIAKLADRQARDDIKSEGDNR